MNYFDERGLIADLTFNIGRCQTAARGLKKQPSISAAFVFQGGSRDGSRPLCGFPNILPRQVHIRILQELLPVPTQHTEMSRLPSARTGLLAGRAKSIVYLGGEILA